MESGLIPGTAVGQLFPRPIPYGPRQAMSPRPQSGCPYWGDVLPNIPPTPPSMAVPSVPFSSLLFIDERIHTQRDQDEALRKQLSHWEQSEAATYQARLNLAESNYAHAATRHLLEVEEQAIHHFQHFWEGLTQDEQAYRATVHSPTRSPTLLSEFTAAISRERAGTS